MTAYLNLSLLVLSSDKWSNEFNNSFSSFAWLTSKMPKLHSLQTILYIPSCTNRLPETQPRIEKSYAYLAPEVQVHKCLKPWSLCKISSTLEHSKHEQQETTNGTNLFDWWMLQMQFLSYNFVTERTDNLRK